MKKIFIYTSVLCFVSWISACDKIEGPYKEQQAATTDSDYTFPPDTTAHVYRVLLEDFTGHTCGNCPAAARDLYNSIKPTYGDKLVTLSVHANFFAIPCPPRTRPPGSPPGSYSADYRTPEGEAWYTYFQFTSNPLGLINRKDGPPPNQVKSATSWNSEIASIVNSTPKVKIRIHNVFDSVTDTLKTYVEAKFLSPVSGTYNINIVLSEDSVISWQLDDQAVDHNVQDYVHRHVLRGSLTGTWGDRLNSATGINSGETFFKGFKSKLQNGLNPNHVHIVAFVMDDATRVILNVAEKAIIE